MNLKNPETITVVFISNNSRQFHNQTLLSDFTRLSKWHRSGYLNLQRSKACQLIWKKTPDVAIAFDVELPIVVTKNGEVASYLKGYHVYKRVRTPISNKVVQTRREPGNPTDKYAVCVLKDGKVVGHLKKGSNGRFAKTIFYFLPSDTYAKCCVKNTGKPVNLADGEGMQVPCMLELEDQGRCIDVLKQNL